MRYAWKQHHALSFFRSPKRCGGWCDSTQFTHHSPWLALRVHLCESSSMATSWHADPTLNSGFSMFALSVLGFRGLLQRWTTASHKMPVNMHVALTGRNSCLKWCCHDVLQAVPGRININLTVLACETARPTIMMIRTKTGSSASD